MKKIILVVAEAVLLGLYYSFPNSLGAPYGFIALAVIFLVFGLLHGIVWGDKYKQGIGAAVIVGALSGVVVTVANLSNVPAGESVFFWFLAGVFINVIIYTIRPSSLLLYLHIFVGMKILVKVRSKRTVITDKNGQV